MLPCSSSAQMEGCKEEERKAHMQTEVKQYLIRQKNKHKKPRKLEGY